MITIAHREPTPNPNAFKFHTGSPLAGGLSLSFASAEEASALPLAKSLFSLPGITAVMIADDFVSVSGAHDTEWDDVEGLLERELAEFSVADATKLAEEQAAASNAAKADRGGDALFQKVNEILEKYVRPALAGDGGGIDLVDIEDKTVIIRYQGACGSCPTSTQNTLMAIENLLQDQVDPELNVVPG